jgi:hypothetical protein
MKQLLPVLLLLLLGACSDKVEVTISAPSSGWEVYGVDTITVTCHPSRNVYHVELLIDSVVVGADTFPGPMSGFEWDVRQLPEASVHKLQARAVSGSREYLSSVLSATVGYRSRLVMDGSGDSLWVYRPDGKRDTGFVPLDGVGPASPRFRAGCGSVVFLANHKLYQAEVPSGQPQVLDSVDNGIYNCDVSPVWGLVAFDGYPAATAHLFTKDGTSIKVQITHDSDFAIIDSSRFTGIVNSTPVFSPDGSKLAYYRGSKCLVPGDPHENEYREDIFVMNRDGSNPVNLTAGVGDGYFSGFTWTFDGKWLLFREGTGEVPDGVLAANTIGRVMTGLPVSPVAMACLPSDSTLAYIGTDNEHRLYSVKLAWTADTLCIDGAGIMLSGESFGSYIDWVDYSRQ